VQQPSPTSIDRTAKLPRARVAKREQCADDLFKLWLEPETRFPTFKPGQYCTIGVKGIERAYSIVSAPHEDWLELFVELVPEGELTPLLWKLAVDDTVSIRPRAKGVFVMSPKFQSHFMVSTVTGVVPFVGILRDYFHKGETGHKFYVIEGASYPGEFGYDDELAKMAAEHPDTVKFVATVSRPTEEKSKDWIGETGRANVVVGKYLDQFNVDPATTLIYACGHPGMIEDVRVEAADKGFAFIEEKFWV
jgi:ferredoxin--NADP+ reductase